jgi:outer membrane receptor protein involved in Fe transport
LTNNGTYFRQFAAGADAFGLRIRAFLEKQTYDQTFSAISNTRNTETLSRVQRVPSQAFGASAAWSRAIGSANTLSVSADFRDSKGFSDELIFANGRVTTLVGAGGAQRSFGVFVQGIWQATKNLNLSIGGRFDHFKNYGALSSTTVAATSRSTVAEFSDRTQTAFSPRVAALYRVNDNVSFVASYAGSFRSPTLNELYRAFRVGNVLTLANENLRSESAKTLEVGARFSGFSGNFSARGNVFYTSIDRPVVSVTLSTTPTLITRQRQNFGKTRAVGFEGDIAYRPFGFWEITAGYVFSDSRFPADDRFVPQVARSQFTIQSSFKPTTKLTFSVQGRVSGRQFEDDLNSLILRKYATFDVFGSYRFRRVEFFVAAENVFNSRYDLGLTPNLTVAGPRFLRGGVRLNFGR